MLEYLIERLQRCGGLDIIIVATSDEESDNPIYDFCMLKKIECFRGDLHNVASRFFEIIKGYNLNNFIRICGDSPLLDQRLVENGINIFKDNSFDIVTNIQKRTYPKGQSFEIINARTFMDTYPLISDTDDLEHVSSFFYKNSSRFKIFNIESRTRHGEKQLSVDTKEDMNTITHIIKRFKKPHWEYSLEDILQLYQANKEPL